MYNIHIIIRVLLNKKFSLILFKLVTRFTRAFFNLNYSYYIYYVFVNLKLKYLCLFFIHGTASTNWLLAYNKIYISYI